MLQENTDNSVKSGKYMKNEKFNKETEIIKNDQTNSMNKMKNAI